MINKFSSRCVSFAGDYSLDMCSGALNNEHATKQQIVFILVFFFCSDRKMEMKRHNVQFIEKGKKTVIFWLMRDHMNEWNQLYIRSPNEFRVAESKALAQQKLIVLFCAIKHKK